MAQLMPLPLTVSCFSKIQIDFTFLVPALPGSPGQRAIKWVCVCVYISSVIVLQVKGSVVDNDGRLKPADQIIGLNGQDLLTATREYIAELLKVENNFILNCDAFSFCFVDVSSKAVSTNKVRAQ